MNCHLCDQYNRGAGTKKCLKCPKYKDIQRLSIRRRTIKYEILPQTLLEQVAEIPKSNKIIDILRLMPADLAALIAMRYYAGLQIQEVAGLVRKSPGTVRYRLHTAIAWLKKYLSEK